MDELHWTRHDGILLMAIPRIRTADLSHVIGAYDALNHDVLPRRELEASLRRLGGAGLVSVGVRFRLTREGQKLVREAKGGGMIERASSVADALCEQPQPPGLSSWSLDDASYEQAVRAYYSRVGMAT